MKYAKLLLALLLSVLMFAPRAFAAAKVDPAMSAKFNKITQDASRYAHWPVEMKFQSWDAGTGTVYYVVSSNRGYKNHDPVVDGMMSEFVMGMVINSSFENLSQVKHVQLTMRDGTRWVFDHAVKDLLSSTLQSQGRKVSSGQN